MFQLRENDRERILDYVSIEPEFNLFIIGDIENFGVDTDEVSVFAGGDGAGWDSLVLRYLNNYVVYSRSDSYDAAAVAEFLKPRNTGMISGKKDVIARLERIFPERKLRTMIMTRCTDAAPAFSVHEDIDIRVMSGSEAETVADLMLQIEEFSVNYHDRASVIGAIKTDLESGGTCYGAFRDGGLVASARTSAENSLSAMVVGVATRPDMRGRGYASAVVSRLCCDVLSKGRQFLCLFYDNPTAGRIYNRIGFTPIGEYALLK
jgi:predicted GNAT family acetyltransferase